ncbi:MAG: DUF262 domain-containing protein [bacterium]|nr:DUF262 domain-containing protein [bacterium]
MDTITFSTDQKTVQEIVDLYDHGRLNLEPGFQRSSVWGDTDRKRLIDSILRNYPLPSVFLYRRTDESGELRYDVVDGKQRIESILMFMGKLRGHRFQVRTQLDDTDSREWIDWRYLIRKRKQSLIMAYKLQAIEVHGDLSTIIKLFVRINSTGKALTGAEKRHANYYKSPFLKSAAKLAKRYENYLIAQGILNHSQISRMKHVELFCELLLAAHLEEVSNKKTALDRVMGSDGLTPAQLRRAESQTTTAINRIKRMFPRIKQLRFRQISDYYSLAVLIQKFEREGLILTNKRRSNLAWDILSTFSNGVDEVRLRVKSAKAIKPGQETFRDYYMAVQSATDEISQRRKREQILRSLLESLFQKKDSKRSFSPEQRRILWNSSTERKCEVCHKLLTWDDFTIDHINPHSKGGRTRLDNAGLLCRLHNSTKGNRKVSKERRR